MRYLVVCFLLACGTASAAHYVDESGNLGNLTIMAGTSPFSIVDEFWILPSWKVGSVTITVSGQQGYGVCGGHGCGGRPPLYKTTFSAPILYSATDGTSPWTAIAPATDKSGTPVTFTCTSSVKSPCIEWQYTGDLPATPYMLSLSGTSCGGYQCGLPGDSHLYVTTHFAP
ncbi:MAG: hypothetical protein JO203_01710 [Gammaproteobacteria bacterium]|nr:hypothetical protein [Gammaproteobacteria bacterium]